MAGCSVEEERVGEREEQRIRDGWSQRRSEKGEEGHRREREEVKDSHGRKGEEAKEKK